MHRRAGDGGGAGAAGAAGGRSRAGLLWMPALALLAGCAGSAGPGWVRGEASPTAPAALYLLAVGTGADPQAAEAAARAGIAALFSGDAAGPGPASPASSAPASSTPASSAAASSTPVGGGLAARMRAAARPPLDDDLRATRIAERWRDERTGTCYALAALERAPLASKWRDAMAERAEWMRLRVGRADSAPGALEKVRWLMGALAAAQERAVFAERYRVVTSGWADPAFRKDADDQADDLSQTLASVRVAVVADRSPEAQGSAGASSLYATLAGTLRDLGFRVLPEGSQEKWVPRVSASLTLASAPGQGSGARERWEGRYEVRGEPPADTLFAAARLSGEAQGASESEAQARARQEGEHALAADLATRIFEGLRLRTTDAEGDS